MIKEKFKLHLQATSIAHDRFFESISRRIDIKEIDFSDIEHVDAPSYKQYCQDRSLLTNHTRYMLALQTRAKVWLELRENGRYPVLRNAQRKEHAVKFAKELAETSKGLLDKMNQLEKIEDDVSLYLDDLDKVAVPTVEKAWDDSSIMKDYERYCAVLSYRIQKVLDCHAEGKEFEIDFAGEEIAAKYDPKAEEPKDQAQEEELPGRQHTHIVFMLLYFSVLWWGWFVTMTVADPGIWSIGFAAIIGIWLIADRFSKDDDSNHRQTMRFYAKGCPD